MLKRNGWTRSRIALREWMPVIVLMCCTFVFNTSEFIPIGLLSDIAADFGITEPGRIVDYGLCLGRGAGFAAVDARGSEDGVPAADARGAGAFHCEPRVVRTFVFLCDADGFADRCGLCACGVLVDRFAAGGPRRTEGSAIGCIGIDYHGNVDCHDRRSAAGSRDRTLRGMADDLLLHCCGRGGRLAVSGGDLSPGPEPRHHFAAQGAFPAGNPALVGVYVLTVLMVTGHYTGYSYIEPFLAQVAGLDNDWITWVLTAFGLVGIVGSLWFSRDYEKCPYAFMRFAVVGIAFFLLLLRLSAFGHFPVVALCICWGLAITIFNLVFQSEIIRLAPEATAIAMSVYSGIYNVGIGAGALVGGFVCTHASIARIGYAGGAIALLAALFCLVRLVPLLKRSRG